MLVISISEKGGFLCGSNLYILVKIQVMLYFRGYSIFIFVKEWYLYLPIKP